MDQMSPTNRPYMDQNLMSTDGVYITTCIRHHHTSSRCFGSNLLCSVSVCSVYSYVCLCVQVFVRASTSTHLLVFALRIQVVVLW